MRAIANLCPIPQNRMLDNDPRPDHDALPQNRALGNTRIGSNLAVRANGARRLQDRIGRDLHALAQPQAIAPVCQSRLQGHFAREKIALHIAVLAQIPDIAPVFLRPKAEKWLARFLNLREHLFPEIIELSDGILSRMLGENR